MVTVFAHSLVTAASAILGARLGTLAQYAFVPVRHERDVPLPNDHVFLVATSGVVAAKGGGARDQYNRASALASAALRIWRAASGSEAATLTAALGESPDMIEQLRIAVHAQRDLPYDADALLGRVEQLCAELLIVQEAGDALVRGDLSRLGELVDRSQANAERLLGNQVPETIALARALGFDPQRFLMVERPESGYGRFLVSQLDDPDTIVLVAERGASVIGYVYGALEPTNWKELHEACGFVHDVYVDEGARRIEAIGNRCRGQIARTALLRAASARPCAGRGYSAFSEGGEASSGMMIASSTS